jgi:geranylgeranyl pyrophosphate synthase/predicted secreted hydrolase
MPVLTEKNKPNVDNFTAPKDWPADGPIDLNIHDLPHASSSTEWWYVNSHITTTCGRNFGVFASFFRKLISIDKKTKLPGYAYSVTWAISDLEEKKYHAVSLIDKQSPKIGLKKLKKGEATKDPYIKRAAIEMLKKGTVPYPDELFKDDPICTLDRLYLKYDTNTYEKLDDGTYRLKLEHHRETDAGAELIFTPQKPVIRHGKNGVVSHVAMEDMFYYFIPKCKVEGTIRIGEDVMKIASATGWYDHEFGAPREEKERVNNNNKDIAWNWIAFQLDNGCEITAYDLIDNKTGEDCGSFAIMVDEKGNRHGSDNFKLTPVGEYFTSIRTFNDYPVLWKLSMPDFGIELEAKAAFDAQEFATVISKPAFWEGRMNIEGTMNGKSIGGAGYIERNGFYKIETLKDFFKVVSRETLKSVNKIIPKAFKQDKFEELISRKGQKGLTKGLDKQQYIDNLIKPIREITDRGGKSWRSYAMVACCDIVGGNSQGAKDWLALPEMMHVGSLIVDDVEDKSDVRRGGPSCHDLYGEAIAINAGSACYFLGQLCIYEDSAVSDKKKIEIYNLYFEALRAAHSGQALDIAGLDYMMPDVLENDNKAKLLVKRVLATHRLKSAAPASYLARIGSLLGDGTEEQTQGLADYFEALGIAFQIIDDTLNLKGFEDNLKTKAEDITAGKITYPIAWGMAKLDKKDRTRLWEIVQMKTDDLTLLTEAMTLLGKHDVITLCENEASKMMDKAWSKLDPLVKDSMVKLNLRAFSWYVLERTY